MQINLFTFLFTYEYLYESLSTQSILMEAKSILKEARISAGLTQSEIAEKIGIGLRMYQKLEDGQFPKYKRSQIQDIDKILNTNLFEIIYKDEQKDEQKERNSYISQRREIKNTGKKRIPFYDADAEAGGMTYTEMTPVSAPSGTIDIGDLLSDSHAAIRIYGNSMIPNYPPGCVVGLSRVNKRTLEPGEVYVIETEDRRMLKRLFYVDDDPNNERLVCYSDNILKFTGGARDGKLAYPPFYINIKDIINLYIVTGVIKRNSNSVIIQNK